MAVSQELITRLTSMLCSSGAANELIEYIEGLNSDDTPIELGADADQVLLNQSTALSANTAVTDVLEGTPVTPATSANTLIISNTTADGDILIAANNGGNSQAWLWIDSSAGLAQLLGAGTAVFEWQATLLEVKDNILLTLGNDGDQAMLNRTATLGANTALTGVLIGTPAVAAIPANSFILSNVTADGDQVFATVPAAGSNSIEWLRNDASAGLTVFNEAGGDIDFRVEGDNNANMHVIDAGTDSQALGSAVVSGAFLTVDGSAVNRSGVTSVGRGEHMPAATFTQTNADPTSLAVSARVFIGVPTFAGANANQTLTDAATLYLAGAAAAGTNVTMTNRPTALTVAAGKVMVTPTATVASAAGADLTGVSVPATTITLTGTTQVTTVQGLVNLAQPTLTDGSAVTVDGYATLHIANAPAAGGSVTLTEALALNVAAGRVKITPTQSVASASGAVLTGLSIPATTITLTGTTQVTAAQGLLNIAQPTLTDGSAVTVDTYASLYIAAAPTTGGSVTLTRAYALWADAGVSRLDDTLVISNAGASATVAEPSGMTSGLFIDQGTADDDVIQLASASDVAHGVTDLAPTGTWMQVQKVAGANGGALIRAFTDVTTALVLAGVAVTEDTTDAPTTSSLNTVQVRGGIKSGTSQVNHQATGNLFGVQDSDGTNEFVVKGDGELYSNQSATVGTFDDHDDALMCADLSYVLSNEYDRVVSHNRPLFERLGILGPLDDKGQGMYSLTKMNMLMLCAIGQLGRCFNQLAAKMGVEPAALLNLNKSAPRLGHA